VSERFASLATLDEAIARGIADVDAGRTTPADEVFKHLEAKYRAMARTKADPHS
jgi:antitoxin ParD1/3/4